MAKESDKRPKRDTLPPGFKIAGRYEIVKPLGLGGMGAVYLAQDTVLGNERIAVKVLHPDFIDDEDLMQRFLREVQLMRRVNHRNVIRTYDVGSDQKLVFFTMEYVQGTSLEQMMQKEALPPKKIPNLIIQICEALEAIHGAGILHRDLKPGNIIVLDDGTIRITDFGVARPEVSNLTNHNEILGSVCYIAPEIWLGEQPTPSVDLYSLGIVLYELTTNKVPFDGASAAELMRLHLDKMPTPPKEHNPTVPVWLNKLVLNLLEKQPAKRPKNARDVAAYVKMHTGKNAKAPGEKKIDEASADFLRQLEEKTKEATKIAGTSSAPNRPKQTEASRPALKSTATSKYTAHQKIMRGSSSPAGRLKSALLAFAQSFAIAGFILALLLCVKVLLYFGLPPVPNIASALAFPPEKSLTALALSQTPYVIIFLLMLSIPPAMLCVSARNRKAVKRVLAANAVFFAVAGAAFAYQSNATDLRSVPKTTERIAVEGVISSDQLLAATVLSPGSVTITEGSETKASVKATSVTDATIASLLSVFYLSTLFYCLCQALGGKAAPLILTLLLGGALVVEAKFLPLSGYALNLKLFLFETELAAVGLIVGGVNWLILHVAVCLFAAFQGDKFIRERD